MKQVNFNNPGGFPLEQETLDRIQTAYRSELYEALKSHLSIAKDKNYIIAPATKEKIGWAIIHQNGEGILYPIECLNQTNNKVTNYLKTTRTGTSLVYGSGASQTAYFDYTALYIKDHEYDTRTSAPSNNEVKTEYYYDLTAFKTLTNLQTIDDCLETITKNIDLVQIDIKKIKTDLESYLPLDGSKAMKGDLDLGTHFLSKLDVKESFASCVRVVEFNLGSKNRKGKLNPQKPTGRALVDSSTDSNTMLTVNYESDWEYTCVGGNVYLNNINTSNKNFKTSESSDISLLLLDNANQVVKSNNLLDSLLSRITKLEKQSTAVPKGMIAIWGQPAPFPEGWEEYVPLRGRMPVGYAPYDSDFGNWNKTDGGSRTQTLQISQMPRHSHTGSTAAGPYNGDDIDGGGGFDGSHSNIFKKRPVEIMPEGSGDPFKILNPYRVVYFIEYTGKPSNTTAPTSDTTAPTSPNLTSPSISTTSITLRWTAATDNVGVITYLVYKDNGITPLAELAKDSLSYNVTGLSANTYYNFHVIAKDAAGNLSIPGTAQYKTDAIAEPNPGGGGGGGCFDVESLVTMASGQSKILKNITIGDKLQGLSFPNEIDESEGNYMLWKGKLYEASKAIVTVVNKKKSIQPNYYEIKTTDTTFKVTGEHPLLATQDGENLEWVRTKNITQSMFLIDKTGNTKAIESITFKEEPLEVILLDVEDVDNYVISGIIAHNIKEANLE